MVAMSKSRIFGGGSCGALRPSEGESIAAARSALAASLYVALISTSGHFESYKPAIVANVLRLDYCVYSQSKTALVCLFRIPVAVSVFGWDPAFQIARR